MTTLPDQQLDSVVVSEAITHCLGLRDWGHMRWSGYRRSARFFATLTPEQQRRTFTTAAIPLKELSPAQQQAVMQYYYANSVEAERQSGEPSSFKPEWWSHAYIVAEYCPAGWFRFEPPMNRPVPMVPVIGKTAAEALAAARRMWTGASPEHIKEMDDGRFWAGVQLRFNEPLKRIPPRDGSDAAGTEE
jgi:hypothetical protein